MNQEHQSAPNLRQVQQDSLTRTKSGQKLPQLALLNLDNANMNFCSVKEIEEFNLSPIVHPSFNPTPSNNHANQVSKFSKDEQQELTPSQFKQSPLHSMSTPSTLQRAQKKYDEYQQILSPRPVEQRSPLKPTQVEITFKERISEKCSLCLSTSSELIIKKNLNKKYMTTMDYYHGKVTNDVIYNEPTHVVSMFKDFLIYDDISEFLKREYTTEECTDRLPKVFQFYEKYAKVFPNYVSLPECKFMFKNIERKQRAIDEVHRHLLDKEEKDQDYELRRQLDDVSNSLMSNLFDTRFYKSFTKISTCAPIDNNGYPVSMLSEHVLGSQTLEQRTSETSIGDMSINRLVYKFMEKDSMTIENVTGVSIVMSEITETDIKKEEYYSTKSIKEKTNNSDKFKKKEVQKSTGKNSTGSYLQQTTKTDCTPSHDYSRPPRQAQGGEVLHPKVRDASGESSKKMLFGDIKTDHKRRLTYDKPIQKQVLQGNSNERDNKMDNLKMKIQFLKKSLGVDDQKKKRVLTTTPSDISKQKPQLLCRQDNSQTKQQAFQSYEERYQTCNSQISPRPQERQIPQYPQTCTEQELLQMCASKQNIKSPTHRRQQTITTSNQMINMISQEQPKKMIGTKSMKNLKTSNIHENKNKLIRPTSGQTKIPRIKLQANYEMFYPQQQEEQEMSISNRCIQISKDKNNNQHFILALPQN